MAFGLNRVELIGRLGADVTVNHLTSGGRVANLSIATDESYIDRNSGDKVDKTEWHRVVTFQDGLIDMFEKHLVDVCAWRRWAAPEYEFGQLFSCICTGYRLLHMRLRAPSVRSSTLSRVDCSVAIPGALR